MKADPAKLFRLLVIAVLMLASAAPLAQQPPTSPDAKCLKCHSKNLRKKLENGEYMSLRVSGEAFGQSVHHVIGCTGCHRDIAKVKHPSRQPIRSRREYSLIHNHWCHQCHAAQYSAYADSVHARQAFEGNAEAPLCSDCHSSHAIQPQKAVEAASGAPCSDCHAEIYEAYAQSVHGQARSGGNASGSARIAVPTCSDCHSAHDVAATPVSGYLRETCLGCHDEARVAHKEWLPNSGMHLTSVSCAACHSPDVELQIDLQLYDTEKQQPLGRDDSSAQHQALIDAIDADADGLSSAELRDLLRQSNGMVWSSDVALRGRLEVATGEEAHRLAPSTEAVRSCENCHRSTADAFRRVTVSISWPDGRKHRFDTDGEILTSMESLRSVGDFYAPGGTRIRVLDTLLLLALLAGVGIPIAHFALGRYLRRRQGKK
jgi:hypothetical protein